MLSFNLKSSERCRILTDVPFIWCPDPDMRQWCSVSAVAWQQKGSGSDSWVRVFLPEFACSARATPCSPKDVEIGSSPQTYSASFSKNLDFRDNFTINALKQLKNNCWTTGNTSGFHYQVCCLQYRLDLRERDKAEQVFFLFYHKRYKLPIWCTPQPT